MRAYEFEINMRGQIFFQNMRDWFLNKIMRKCV